MGPIEVFANRTIIHCVSVQQPYWRYFWLVFQSNVNINKTDGFSSYLIWWTLFAISVLIVSKHFQTLTGDAHKRYLEKISIIGGQDPYVILDVEWSTNPDMFSSLGYFDIVNYLVLGSSSFYSMVEFKNYKSLEAYDRFVSG